MRSGRALVIAVAACSFRCPAALAGEGGCAVGGVVKDANTGAPLSEAKVVLEHPAGAGGPSATTNAGGQFCIEQAEPGRYRLDVERPGYTGRAYSRGAPEFVSVGRDLRAAGIEVDLWPAGTISGSVVDEAGSPVTTADVQVYRRESSAEALQLLPVWAGATDAGGRYRATGLPPGQYYVAAVARAQATHSRSDEREQIATSFYPGTPDPAAAIALDLAPGAEASGARIAMRRAPAVTLKGSLIAADGGSAAGALILLRPRWLGSAVAFDQKSAGALPDGTFEMKGVLPGSYWIEVVRKRGEQAETGRQDLEVGRYDIEGLRVPFGPGARAAGSLRLENDRERRPGRVFVYLVGEGSDEIAVAAQSDESGAVALERIPPGKYEVRVAGLQNNLYVKSIQVGSQDAKRDGLVVGDTDPGPLDIVLSTGAEISGTVTDPENTPVPAAVIVAPAATDRSSRGQCLTTAADQAGQFKAAGLAPGEYVATASLRTGAAEACQDPQRLATALQRGTRFTVQDAGRQTLQLQAE